MSSGLNFTLTCYDDVALSIINDFWDEPDRFHDEINESRADRYNPYTTEKPLELPDITYKVVCTENGNDPFMLYPLSPSSSTISADSSFMSSESCLSVLSSTVDSIEIPLEWLESIEELPTLDENALFEALEMIEREPVTSTTDHLVPSYNNHISKILKKNRNSSTPDKSKEFCCIACDKYFKFGSGLKKHFRTKTHRRVVEDKFIQDPATQPETWKVFKYFCFICSKGFAKEHQVVNHIQDH